jgi:hypothetical protein
VGCIIILPPTHPSTKAQITVAFVGVLVDNDPITTTYRTST